MSEAIQDEHKEFGFSLVDCRPLLAGIADSIAALDDSTARISTRISSSGIRQTVRPRHLVAWSRTSAKHRATQSSAIVIESKNESRLEFIVIVPRADKPNAFARDASNKRF